MAFQENLNASISMFSFSDVSHGSGCHAGFIQDYAWCSLSLCSCRLTTRMGSLEMFLPPPPPRFFFLGVNLDY